jgi:phosphoglycerate dehydrogenase-like enzyme
MLLHGAVVMKRLKGLYILDQAAFDLIYGPDEQADIANLLGTVPPLHSRQAIAENPSLLSDVQAIFSGWGAPVMDRSFLDLAPKLEVVFYGAGATGYWITPDVWARNIAVTSASVANAIPVAEYALAVTLFSLKHGWSLLRETRERRLFPPRDGAPGCFGSTVGLISLGVTARAFLKLLKPYDLKVLAHDPFVTESEAATLGVELVSLDEIFRRCEVVSLHTPLLPETRDMIRREHLSAMKPGATFVNTARGEIVREDEMIDVLSRRPDLQAVLDVTCDEPPAPASPLYTMPNVVLTPHIAGSVGTECRRMGRYMVDELRRYLCGEPLRFAVTPDMAVRSSHRPVSAKLSLTLPKPRPAAISTAALSR